MRNTGLIVFDTALKNIVHSACLRTESRVKETNCYVADDNARCVRSLCAQMDAVLLRYPAIKGAFAELPHGGAKSSRAASLMGLSVGGVSGFLFARGIKIFNVTPLDVKHLVRPKGEVEKNEVQKYAEQCFGNFLGNFNKGQAEHIADAAGALLAGIRKYYP